MSKAAKALPAFPRKEYKTITMVVQGPRVEPFEIVIGEMAAGDLADCSKAFFEILGRLIAQDGGEKLAKGEPFTKDDLTGAMVDLSVDAAMEITARSAEVPLELLRKVDGEDGLEAMLAALNLNRPFFQKLLARFGMSLDMFKLPAGAKLVPKE